MADQPFALWREVGGPPEGPLSDVAFAEFADIYAALGAQGISQRQADETSLEVIGAMLGLHRTDEQKPDEGLIAARMKHARGEGPKPEPKTPDAGAMGALMVKAKSARG